MKAVKKVISFFHDAITIVIPSVAFSILFVTFCVQVFFRYVLNDPLPWAYEVTVIAYMWTIVLGACLAQRRDEHVKFTIVGDLFPKKVQLITNIIGNLIIAACLCMLVVPSIKYLIKIVYEKTTYLRLPTYWAKSPFILFIVVNIVYFVKLIYRDILAIAKHR